MLFEPVVSLLQMYLQEKDQVEEVLEAMEVEVVVVKVVVVAGQGVLS